MEGRRLRMRRWLEEQIDSGQYPGVAWLNKPEKIFKIPWKHAARHGWSLDRDATLFQSWAAHTGRYRPGKDKPDPKTWKANFRCALNSLPDVGELPEFSRKRGSEACRVYKMFPCLLPCRPRSRRQPGRPAGAEVRPQEQSWKASGFHAEAVTRADMQLSDDQTLRGMWDQLEYESDHVFKTMDDFSPADPWCQTRGGSRITPWEQWDCPGDSNFLPYSEPFCANVIQDLSDFPTVL